MSLNLVRRSTKGAPLTATDHDGNLDKLETAIEAVDPTNYATAAQGAKADTAIQPGNTALTNAREWTAETISQAEAEAGTATTRRAFTAQRVFQAVAAWWAASAAKTKLDGVQAGATANSSDATLLNRANHTGTQGAGTITGLANVATSGAYADLSGRPTLGTAAPLDVAAAGDASSSQVVRGNDSRLTDARTPTAHTQAASTISDSTAAGRALLTAADASAQRTSLGLGTAATTNASAYATAAQGSKADSAVQPGSLAAVATSGAYADLSGRPSLGTAAAANTGTSAGNVVQLDGTGKLPAVDGSQLTNLPSGGGGSTDLGYTASTRLLTSSTGADVTLPLATTSDAGLLSSSDKSKLDGIAAGAEVNVNADWNATSGDAQILNKPPLGTAAAANTGDFATAAQGALAATAVQPAALSGYVQSGDSRLTDAREWSAETISQAEAEAGTATTRRAFTAQRVFQSVAAWWSASAAKTKLDGIASGATANATDAQLRDRSTHTGTQAASTITGLATVATSGAYSDLSGRPTVPGLSDATPQAPGTAAAGTASSASRSDHVHALPPLVSSSTAGLQPASSYATITYAADIELDVAALDGQVRTINLTGNLSLTSVNRAAGRRVVLRLICDGTQRTLTFPSGWVFVGTKPANIAASKTAVLSVTWFGTATTDAVAAYAVQS